MTPLDLSHECYILHAIKRQKLTMNGVQNITRGPLGKAETRFLAKIAGRATFTVEAARDALAYARTGSTQKFLERLQEKGWIKRVRRGRFAVIPLSSGEGRTRSYMNSSSPWNWSRRRQSPTDRRSTITA